MILCWYNQYGYLVDTYEPVTFSEGVHKAKDWSRLTGFVFFNAFTVGRQSWWFRKGRCLYAPHAKI